ncbi:Ribonuclease H-like domain,Integrase, catalytic core, partial [Cinara cedri]
YKKKYFSLMLCKFKCINFIKIQVIRKLWGYYSSYYSNTTCHATKQMMPPFATFYKTQLVYYDDPNELVSNLIFYLLFKMQTSHNIANELHRPARRKFPRRRVISLFKDDLWQADLIDMQQHSRQNSSFKYILIVIDTTEVTNNFLQILKTNQSNLLQTDNGTEFYNKPFQDLMKEYNIKHYSTYSSIKAGMVESVIRTIKNKIYKYFTSTGSWNWYNSISKLIANYNNTKHTTIKCTSFEARKKHQLPFKLNNIKIRKPKFEVNDKVRISKYKHAF